MNRSAIGWPAVVTVAVALALGVFAMNPLPIGVFHDDTRYLLLARSPRARATVSRSYRARRQARIFLRRFRSCWPRSGKSHPLLPLMAAGYLHTRTPSEAAAQLADILDAYHPRFLLVGTPEAFDAARLLAHAAAPRIRFSGVSPSGILLYVPTSP